MTNTKPSKNSKKSKIKDEASASIVTIAEAGADDLRSEVEKLSKKLDEQIDSQRSEQRNIIIGVLIASVLIVVTIAVEVIIFNASFNNSLESLQKQQQEDYRSMRDSIDKNQDSMNKQLFDLKLNQTIN